MGKEGDVIIEVRKEEHGDKVHFFVEESLCNSMYVRNRVFFHKGVSEAKLWKRERDKN